MKALFHLQIAAVVCAVTLAFSPVSRAQIIPLNPNDNNNGNNPPPPPPAAPAPAPAPEPDPEPAPVAPIDPTAQERIEQPMNPPEVPRPPRAQSLPDLDVSRLTEVSLVPPLRRERGGDFTPASAVHRRELGQPGRQAVSWNEFLRWAQSLWPG